MDETQAQQLKRRIFLIAGLFVMAALTVVASLARWQLFETPPSNLQEYNTTLPAPRGNIFDRDGHLLATDIPEYDVKFSPNQVHDEQERREIAEQLFRVLDLPLNTVLERVVDVSPDALYSPITSPNRPNERIPQHVMESIKNISGIGFDMFYQRTYPEGELAAQVVGFTQDRTGVYGIEKQYDTILQGVSGFASNVLYLPEVIADPSQYVKATPGADIYLTIDRAIQKIAEDELAAATETYGAPSGQVVIMNPRTGEILAMANYPTFNPNNFPEAANEPQRYNNDIIFSRYEPGSVFKVVTMASALDMRAVSSVSTINDFGVLWVGNKQIRNSDLKAHGIVTMTRVLELSLNVGTAQIATIMGADNFFWYIDAFGFREPTGIDLPNEVSGNYPQPGDAEWFPEEHKFISFGQGIEVTPIELISAVSTIANRGIRMKPYVMQKTVYHQPEMTTETQPQVLNQPISAETAAVLTQMLVNALNAAESAARIDGYKVAGKTGTAQVSEGNAGYNTGKTIHSFAGYFPADDPQVAILVILNNPAYAQFGSQTAAPTFSRIGAQVARILDIPPQSPTLAQTQ